MKIPVLYQLENSIREIKDYVDDLRADNEFKHKLKKILKENHKNCYRENYRVFPDLNKKQGAPNTDFTEELPPKIDSVVSLTRHINIKGLNHTYQNLADESSKDLLLRVIAYRILGHTRIRLPLADENFWLPMIDLEKKCKKDECMETKFWKLNYFDLTAIGYDIRLFFNTESVFIGLGLKEYGYDKGEVDFKVEKGDYVIDGGACYGDTALYFAHDAGEDGKVFSFEFLQDNLNVFEKNLELNPKLKDRIKLFQNALWENSNENLFIVENGPASYCSMSEPGNYTQKVETKSIDDLVESGEIPKVDFIKFDIEGAEMEAIKGCEKTIKKFKPKLAICLYHKNEHFISIPKYIKDLVPEYKLYIDHHTMAEGETVMYAIAPKG